MYYYGPNYAYPQGGYAAYPYSENNCTPNRLQYYIHLQFCGY